jgi:uncharacterized protein
MYITKYLVKLTSDENYSVLINTLSGAVDVFKNDLSDYLFTNKGNNILTTSLVENKLLLEKKQYLFNDVTEEKKQLSINISKFSNITNINPKVYLSVSNFCNASCIYCYQDDGITHNNFLSYNDIKHAFIYFEKHLNNLTKESNCNHINRRIILFGGEPLQLENIKLIEIILKHAKNSNIKITIITNGFCINYYKSLISKYKNTIDVVVLTLDGTEETHNIRRSYKDGTGSFGDVCKSINTLLSLGIKINVNCNIDKQNKGTLLELIEYIKINKWHLDKNFRFGIGKVMFPGKYLHNYKFEMSDFEYIIFSSSLLQIEKQYIIKNYFTNSLLPSSHLYQLYNTGLGALPKYFGCDALTPGIIVLEPDGFVYPCTQIVNNKGSYVCSTKWNSTKPINIPECRECVLLSLCGSGCRIKSLERNNIVDHEYCNSIQDYLQLFLDSNKFLVDYIFEENSKEDFNLLHNS